jgi:hypothetical protein
MAVKNIRQISSKLFRTLNTPICISKMVWSVLVLLLLHPCPGAGVDDGAAARLRGGSAALLGNAAAAGPPLRSSPLRSFIQRTAVAHAAAQPRPVGQPIADSGAVDNDGDSLMGQPTCARVAAGACAHVATGSEGGGQPACARAAAGSEGGGQGKRPPVPFKLVCGRLLAALAEDETRTTQLLADLVRELWQHWPADLAALVCLLRDQLLSPTLQGVELLPATQVLRVVADSLAKTPEGLRESLGSYDGDLAVAARRLRSSQRTLFPPPPLTLQQVVASLRDVAERRDMALRHSRAKQLLVAASGEEAFVIVKALQGSLRLLGFTKGVIVTALATAAHAHPPATLPRAAPASDEPEDTGSTSTQHELVGIIWQVSFDTKLDLF